MQFVCRLFSYLLTVSFVAFAVSLTVVAQTQTTGAIQGVVYEAGSKASIPDAIVSVRNEENSLVRTTITNEDGLYFINLLPPGLYTISAKRDGYENDSQSSASNFPIRLSKTNLVQPPPIILRKIGSAPSPASTTATSTSSPGSDSEFERQVNTVNAMRGGNFDRRQLIALPLAGTRTFESLAFLLPGVAPPPQTLGDAIGPGVGAGIGTAGQFSVNGLRARSNNFTVDGSDNNDEDVGVRRQGFVALVPQSIESVQEFQMSTQLWDAGMGRNLGSQLNAVSRSGGNQVHGTLYDFFNHDAFNARRFFDYTSDKAANYPLTARARFVDGQSAPQIVPVRVDGVPVIQPNPSADRDPLHRHQGGFALGWPLSKQLFGPLAPQGEPKTFFFTSFEYQRMRARRETHFSVPTVAQRGLFGFGATGYNSAGTLNGTGANSPQFATTTAGDAAFSLFPFPNNPIGPYGENTFTQVLPADADGRVFSSRFDHDFKLFGQQIAHTLTGRYNFTTDRRQVPAVGNALFSGIEPRIVTHNLSLLLSSQLTARMSNQLRVSFGRTRLNFAVRPDPLITGSRLLPGTPSLINATILSNQSFNYRPAFQFESLGNYVTLRDENKLPMDVEAGLGTNGQIVITPFSPVGLDPFLFPQSRTSNTFQYADTLTLLRGQHLFKFGADVRRVQLNSRQDRNYRTQLLYSGIPDLTTFLNPAATPLPFNPTPGWLSGADLVAQGTPTGAFTALGFGTPDSTIGLRFWQQNYFFNDNWRVARGLTFDYGLRYEFNAVPREVNNRIEKTFAGTGLPAVDPAVRSLAFISTGQMSGTIATYDTQALLASLNGSLGALRNFLDGRQTIYDADKNNFAPHVGFAWDPLAASSTQAGRTVVRGGIGLSYDVTLGSVVSQSRNVFPTFVPFNVDANSFVYRFYTSPKLPGKDVPCPPSFCVVPTAGVIPISVALLGANGQVLSSVPSLFALDKLNVVSVPPGIVQPILSVLLQPPALTVNRTGGNLTLNSGGGLAFTLPERHLRSPYALQYNLQIERELFGDFLFNAAYVGSRGVKLTRFRTPNGGLNSITVPGSSATNQGVGVSSVALPPLSNLSSTRLSRPIPQLGAFTIFDSSATSSYHALQTSVTKRFRKGWQMTAAYTWSHALDDVSDVFDLAGAFNLPQDDRDLHAERGNANFDLRHRFAYSVVSEVPFLSRFNNAGGAKEFVFGNWQFASIATYQTGQPFTVNTSFDVNLDGNLTDRLNSFSGLNVLEERQRRLQLTGSSTTLLAATGANGRVGRNTFRAAGIANTDFTLIKNFRLKESQSLVFRAEFFNLWNRTHFGLPVRILEAPSFGQSADTVLTPRQIQFALKYVF